MVHVEKVSVLIADKCSVTIFIRFVKFPSDSSILNCEANTYFFMFYVWAHLSLRNTNWHYHFSLTKWYSST